MPASVQPVKTSFSSTRWPKDWLEKENYTSFFFVRSFFGFFFYPVIYYKPSFEAFFFYLFIVVSHTMLGNDVPFYEILGELVSPVKKKTTAEYEKASDRTTHTHIWNNSQWTLVSASDCRILIQNKASESADNSKPKRKRLFPLGSTDKEVSVIGSTDGGAFKGWFLKLFLFCNQFAWYSTVFTRFSCSCAMLCTGTSLTAKYAVPRNGIILMIRFSH